MNRISKRGFRLGCRCLGHDTRLKASMLLQPAVVQPPHAAKGEVLSKSQRLLTEQGFIKSIGTGNYVLFNSAVRSLEKLITLVDVCMAQGGCQKILLPTLISAELWKQTGRWNDMISELYTATDRHGKQFVLGPTHEEAITHLIASLPSVSYRNLPLKLYQVSPKFRDEMRPQSGLIRCKEFVMKDLYTFDTDLQCAEQTYQLITQVYHTFFDALEVPFIMVAGDTGTIGGRFSHEFHFLSEIGNDQLLVCPECGQGSNSALHPELKAASNHGPQCQKCRVVMLEKKAIEVGHTFLLGDKYSSALKAHFVDQGSSSHVLQMGCYGLGLSRIMGAAVEVLSTETQIRWPKAIVPFSVCLIPPKEGSNESNALGTAAVLSIYDALNESPVFHKDVLLDDRPSITVGKKLRDADKNGYRFIVLFGKKSKDATNPQVEIHFTDGRPMLEVSVHDIVPTLVEFGEEE